MSQKKKIKTRVVIDSHSDHTWSASNQTGEKTPMFEFTQSKQVTALMDGWKMEVCLQGMW